MSNAINEFELCLLLPINGRSISDERWEVIDAQHIKIWEEAIPILSKWGFDYLGGQLKIETNWTSFVRRMKENYERKEEFSKSVREGNPDLGLVSMRRPVSLKCLCSVSELDKSKSVEHVVMHHVVSFLHDVFLLMNLASPGSIDLYRAKVQIRKPNSRRRQYEKDISLSDFHFDLANINSRDGKGLEIRSLSPSKVINWYAGIRRDAGQLPTCRMEKALFAMMHISGVDQSINTVVWLFYALEAFFDTRPGENFRALLGRIELLLNPGSKEMNHIKRKLRALYDIRSSFVHGGRDVIHPLHNEYTDPRVDGSYSELADAIEFGFGVLLASMQELISRGWNDLRFGESLSGSPIK